MMNAARATRQTFGDPAPDQAGERMNVMSQARNMEKTIAILVGTLSAIHERLYPPTPPMKEPMPPGNRANIVPDLLDSCQTALQSARLLADQIASAIGECMTSHSSGDAQ